MKVRYLLSKFSDRVRTLAARLGLETTGQNGDFRHVLVHGDQIERGGLRRAGAGAGAGAAVFVLAKKNRHGLLPARSRFDHPLERHFAVLFVDSRKQPFVCSWRTQNHRQDKKDNVYKSKR